MLVQVMIRAFYKSNAMMPHYLLRTVLAHIFQEQQGFVDMSPRLALALQSSSNDAHDLFVVLIVV